MEARVRHAKSDGTVQASELLGDVEVQCIDGRCGEPVVGTPGGSLGEFVVVMTAVESQLSRTFSEEDVVTALFHVVSQTGCFYHHTDQHHLTALQRASETLVPTLASNQWWLGDSLAPLNQAEESALCNLVVQPAFVGCGHVKSMLIDSAAFGVRTGLVESSLRAFFGLFWRREHDMRYRILMGEHQETVVHVVRTGTPQTGAESISMMRPKTEGQQRFVYHPDVMPWLRLGFFNAMRELPWSNEIDVQTLLSDCQRMGARQVEVCIATLAPHCPIQELDLR